MASIKGCVLKNTVAPTGQSFTGTGGVVQWANSLYDTDNFHAGTDGKITIPSQYNGMYGIFTGMLNRTTNALPTAAIWERLTLLKNGSNSFDGAAGNYKMAGSTSGTGQAGTNSWCTFNSGLVPLATNDFFEMHLRCNDGGVSSGGYTLATESSFGLFITDGVNVTQRALVTLSANSGTNVNLSTPTPIGWDTETYDTDNIHDTTTNNDRFTIPSSMNNKAGVLYAIIYLLNVSQPSDTSIAISKNGSFTYDGFSGFSGTMGGNTNALMVCQTQPIRFQTGDIFRAVAYSSDTAVQEIAINSWFSAWVYGDFPGTGAQVVSRGYIL